MTTTSSVLTTTAWFRVQVAAWATVSLGHGPFPDWAPAPSHGATTPFEVVAVLAPTQAYGSYDCLPLKILIKHCIFIVVDREVRYHCSKLGLAPAGGEESTHQGTAARSVPPFDVAAVQKLWQGGGGGFLDMSFLRPAVAQTIVVHK